MTRSISPYGWHLRRARGRTRPWRARTRAQHLNKQNWPAAYRWRRSTKTEMPPAGGSDHVWPWVSARPSTAATLTRFRRRCAYTSISSATNADKRRVYNSLQWYIADVDPVERSIVWTHTGVRRLGVNLVELLPTCRSIALQSPNGRRCNPVVGY